MRGTVYLNWYLEFLIDTIDAFKNRLDKIQKDQDMIYDYKSDLTGNGSRSLINVDESLTYCT